MVSESGILSFVLSIAKPDLEYKLSLMLIWLYWAYILSVILKIFQNIILYLYFNQLILTLNSNKLKFFLDICLLVLLHFSYIYSFLNNLFIKCHQCLEFSCNQKMCFFWFYDHFLDIVLWTAIWSLQYETSFLSIKGCELYFDSIPLLYNLSIPFRSKCSSKISLPEKQSWKITEE